MYPSPGAGVNRRPAPGGGRAAAGGGGAVATADGSPGILLVPGSRGPAHDHEESLSR